MYCNMPLTAAQGNLSIWTSSQLQLVCYSTLHHILFDYVSTNIVIWARVLINGSEIQVLLSAEKILSWHWYKYCIKYNWKVEIGRELYEMMLSCLQISQSQHNHNASIHSTAHTILQPNQFKNKMFHQVFKHFKIR